MNLYRSFGNLLEAWMTEGGGPNPDSERPTNNNGSPLASCDMGSNLRSESVDSGVETASSDTSYPTTPPCSLSAINADIATFAPERGGQRLSPASTTQPQSPLLCSPAPFSTSSSSSPGLRASRAQEGYATLHLKVEKALQRTEPKRLKDNPEPLTAGNVVLRRKPQGSFFPKRYSSEIVKGHRAEGSDLRRSVNLSVPTRPMSETICRRPLSLMCEQPAQTISQNLGEAETKGLSPGLSYLEHVCQMLEDFARQQMHIQALQMETDALGEHQPDMEALDTCWSESKASDTDGGAVEEEEEEEDLSSSCLSLETAEQSPRDGRRGKYDPRTHFWQRSASDTNLAKLHLRRVNTNCRGQHLSKDDLLEKEEEDHEQQESVKEETNKIDRNWKLKIGSLGRDASAVRDTKSQQTQPSERMSARRRLTQLFRRRKRRTTLPV